jgi:hypothetical protein
MGIGVKDLDADMISASIVVVPDAARDLGDVAPGEQGIDETVTAARGQVIVGEPEPAQVVGVVGQVKVGREMPPGDRPGVSWIGQAATARAAAATTKGESWPRSWPRPRTSPT